MEATVEQSGVVHVDYVNTAVPQEERQSWWTTTATFSGWIVWPGMPALGALMMQGESFWSSLVASLIGAFILAGISILLGVIAMRHGFNTYMIGDRTFGKGGGRVIGACLALSLVGWFGVSTGAAGQALKAVFPAVPYEVYAIVLCAVFGGTAAIGFSFIRVIAKITIIPLVVLLVAGTIYAVALHPEVNVLAGSMPVIDNAVGFLMVIGLVVTNWIMGCTTTPDILRYGKRIRDVAVSQVLAFGLVFGVLNWIAVPFAIATGSPDVIAGFVKIGGALWTIIALFVIVFATWTTADAQCWIASLGLTYAINKPNSRWIVALIIAALGFVGTLYIWNYIFVWVDFIGTVLPAISAMLLIEYYLVRKQTYSSAPPAANLAAYIAWIVGALLGLYTGVYLKIGVGAINSFVIAGVAYYVLRLVMVPKEVPVPQQRGAIS